MTVKDIQMMIWQIAAGDSSRDYADVFL